MCAVWSSAGSHRPLVLVIDDIQWAEPLFLDLLEHLAEWSKTAPVLIVGLARPELREIRPALTETGRRVALVVSLEGLDAPRRNSSRPSCSAAPLFRPS